jgi:uncharacterized phage-associated protein
MIRNVYKKIARQNTNKTLDNSQTENHVTHQQSPWTQILQVNRQKESATGRHVLEAQDTFLQSHE